jgi:HlyD family secretion protein
MRIVNADLQLRPGMSMTADIETETRHNVLTVPIQSVTTRMPKVEVKPEEGDGQSGTVMAAGTSVKKKEENKAKEIVFVVESGVVKAMPVKRGISDDAYMEITEGVKDSMQVVSGTYKAINRELEDGAKVRVEEPKKQGVKKTGEGA